MDFGFLQDILLFTSIKEEFGLKAAIITYAIILTVFILAVLGYVYFKGIF